MHSFFTYLTVLLGVPSALAAATIDRRQTADTIPNAWIVTLKSSAVTSEAISTVGALNGITPRHTYNSAAFKGFSFHGSDDALLNSLASHPSIESIEPDVVVSINAPTVAAAQTPIYIRQANAPWGLVRISHRTNAKTAVKYVYKSAHQGENVYVYVIDTGINFAHEEFQGRAVSGVNFVNASADAQDDNGHGTHVSGTIGGQTVGVAKKVNLVAVKVLDADGTGAMSAVLAGVDYAVNDSTARKIKALANLSLGTSYYETLNTAVSNAVNAGVFFAVAAGNQGANASLYSPSSAPEACVIAASDDTDTRAYFSNYGAAVDMYAPGVDVYSAWIGNDTAYATLSGTSMASPHAAGTAAFWMSYPAHTASSTQLCGVLQKKATQNVIQSPGTDTTANLLNNPWPDEK